MIGNVDKRVAWPEKLDYKKQSVEVPGTKRPGQTGHYRSGVFGLIDHQTPNTLLTLPQIFTTGLSQSATLPFLGYRPVTSTNPLTFGDYVWQTYEEVDVRRRAVGSAVCGLFARGEVGGGELDTVGIWSANRPEWQIVDLALQAYGKVGVSLYDTLGRDSVEYIINHAQLSMVFTTLPHLPTLLSLAHKCPPLKMIVCIDDLSEDTKGVLRVLEGKGGVRVIDMKELEAQGRATPLEPVPVTPGDVVSICYTSGTTNTPKGVVLTHGNLAGATQSNLFGSSFPERGVLLSYLPLAHIYGRICELSVISVGGSIGYFTNDPLRLLSDAQTLKPSFFPSVPRVLNRVYQAAMIAGDVPGLRGALFRKAVSDKVARLRSTGVNKHAVWDRVVFSKIQAVLGGNVKMVSCGSAPIAADVMDFLKIALACDVIEENCGTCTRVLPNDPTSSGTVGAPQPCNEIKLVDVPTMGYTSEDKPNPRGELCVRGTNCFRVYYRDEKNTKDTVDEEGWIHTGDVGEVDECGRFKIVDRVKNIMKLSQGEYVALEKIENLYSACPLTAQVFVHGDSLQPYLVGVVVPDPVQLAGIVSRVTKKRVGSDDVKALKEALGDERVVNVIMAELDKEAEKNSLKGFERLKRIHLSLELFSVDNGTLTPTLKIRRKDAYNWYKAELDGLYALGEPQNGKSVAKL